jgi:hypothetical protein
MDGNDNPASVQASTDIDPLAFVVDHICHELRQPTTSLGLLWQAASRADSLETTRTILQQAERSIENLHAQLDTLQLLPWLLDQTLRPRPAEFGVRQVLGAALECTRAEPTVALTPQQPYASKGTLLVLPGPDVRFVSDPVLGAMSECLSAVPRPVQGASSQSSVDRKAADS